MKHLGTVNEGACATITLEFVDENGSGVTPMSGTYRIDTANGVIVRAVTPFAPSGSTHALPLAVEDNTVQDTDLAVEPHIVTVTWVYGIGDKTGTEECQYDVQNLLFI